MLSWQLDYIASNLLIFSSGVHRGSSIWPAEASAAACHSRTAVHARTSQSISYWRYGRAVAVPLSARVPHKTASGHGNCKGNVYGKLSSPDTAVRSRSRKILLWWHCLVHLFQACLRSHLSLLLTAWSAVWEIFVFRSYKFAYTQFCLCPMKLTHVSSCNWLFLVLKILYAHTCVFSPFDFVRWHYKEIKFCVELYPNFRC